MGVMNELVSWAEYLILLMVFLLLWGGHWMRWRVFPWLVDDSGQLHRPLAYVYGTGCILIGFVAWAQVQALNIPLVSVWRAVRFLFLDVVAAGAGTMAPRLVKAVEEAIALRGDVEDYEQAIQE